MTGLYADAVGEYWQAGWRGLLPLPPGKKYPPPLEWTGHGAPYPSWPDVMAWAEEQPDANLALRMPPGVLGIDVDAYNNKPGAATLTELEGLHGPLPATWTSTSRSDGISGIRFFTVPAGVNWKGALPGVETVHAGHRYAVVAPSIHPEGRMYRWLDPSGGSADRVPTPDELPELPLAWVAALAQPYPRAESADLDSEQVRAWLDQLRTGDTCRPVAEVLVRAVTAIGAGESRHDTARDASRAVAAFGGEGHAGTLQALRALGKAFVTAVGPDRGDDLARKEWRSILAGAVELAAAKHPEPASECDCLTEEGFYEMFGGQQEQPTATEYPPDDRRRFFDREYGLLLTRLVAAVEEMGPIAVGPGDRLYHYADGYWQPDGEKVVISRVVELLGDRHRMSHVGNVLQVFRSKPVTLGEPDERYWNLPNGLLDWRTGELLPHSPSVPSIIRIPIRWDPDATCPEIEKWIDEVFPNDARELVEEIVGYTLYNDNPLHKAILLFGRGRNGKGTFLRLLTALVGRENVSAVTPQDLDENRFQAAELHGRLANLVGDVDPKVFKATETFKQVTGGDRVTAERKYGHPFTFYCRALMVCAFNRLPRSVDTTEGFFSRWLVLPMNGYFPEGVADPARERKMHTDAELRGLLALAREGLVRLLGRWRFTESESVDGATAEFRRVADPVRAFLTDYVPTLLTEWVPRKDVYTAYDIWTSINGHQLMASSAFYERVQEASHDVVGYIIREKKDHAGTRGLQFVVLKQSAAGTAGSPLFSARMRPGDRGYAAPAACRFCNQSVTDSIWLDVCAGCLR